MSQLKQRLVAGEVVLIDGATGTELELADVAMVDNAWCALASLTNPEAVKKVHAENIRAGAELIIANTFVCSRHILERAGHSEHFEQLNTLGIELALEARNETDAPLVIVAGSISTTAQGGSQPSVEVARANFGDQVRLQAEAGVELFLLEMMREIPNTETILDAIEPTGIPAWVGFSCEMIDDEPSLLYGDCTLAEALEAMKDRNIELVAIMHTETEEIDRCLDVVFDHWSGPVGVYAHTGGWEPPHWVFNDMISVEDYAEACLRWVDRGVQVIGGCCGIGPAHISHLEGVLPRHLPGRSRPDPHRRTGTQ